MKPLAGITVLDLSRVLAGPFCTMRLADLGARVIKVESSHGDATRGFGPPFADSESPYFMSFNRGKESIVLDLKSREGKEFVSRVLQEADVLVQNFRPGVMERLGFGDDILKTSFPRLIQVSITGYGPESSRYHEPAFDLAIQGESGLIAMSGRKDGESCRVPISIADLSAGLTASEAVLAALFHREKSGEGARIDIALLDSLVALFGYQVQSSILTGEAPKKMGHRHPNLVPYQGFTTADGMLVLAVAADNQWQRLIATEGMPSALKKKSWETNRGRVEGREEIEGLLKVAFSRETIATWQERLKESDVPMGPVRTVIDMLKELNEEESTFLKDYQHQTLGTLQMPSSPIIWNRSGRYATDLAPPTLGQHTAQLVKEFADDEEIAQRWGHHIAGLKS